MRRLLIAPLLISISLLSSGFFFKYSNVKKLFCKNPTDITDLSLFIDRKTGQLFIYKIDELFADKVPNVLIPFRGTLETKDYVMKGSSGISSGIFRADFTRTFFDNGERNRFFYEVDLNNMTGKLIRNFPRMTSQYKKQINYRKCEFKDLDKGLKIKDK
tara:strand:- start:8 stop:484 length:477 start_codon:yes stop_codon:yes gene_type:complete